jgi:AcrR family transcriptional regulator
VERDVQAGPDPAADAAGDRSHPGPPRSWLRMQERTRGPSRALRGRRGDILDAALKLFNTAGYSLTGVQDIASEASASVGSIYHHFNGKEDIAAALYVEGLADYHRGLLHELQKERKTAEEAVKALVRNHLRWIERNRALATFLLTSRDPEVLGATVHDTRETNRRIFHAVNRWRDRWIEAGQIDDLPIGLFHSIVLGPSQEFARHWVAGRVQESIDEAEPVLAEAAWKAVRK